MLKESFWLDRLPYFALDRGTPHPDRGEDRVTVKVRSLTSPRIYKYTSELSLPLPAWYRRDRRSRAGPKSQPREPSDNDNIYSRGERNHCLDCQRQGGGHGRLRERSEED